MTFNPSVNLLNCQYVLIKKLVKKNSKSVFYRLSVKLIQISKNIKLSVKNNYEIIKNQRTGHISEAILPTDFILCTLIQPKKAHSMI